MKKYILLLFLGFIGSLHAQIIKPVFYVKQDKTNWCSAACSKCVLDYYGIKLNGQPLSQCVIMDYVRINSNGYGPILETNFPLSDFGNLKITNLLGVVVYETQNVTSNTIQLPAAASGQHFVVLVLKDGTVLSQKMMLQR
jgi:hypothetical protein